MSKWFTTPATTPCQEYPETIFVRWVIDNYRLAPNYRAVRFLELGSGSGADLRFLMVWGFDAIGIDSHDLAYANIHCDFADIYWDAFKERFDCIYELNVLCCVESPPYKEIAASLKPGGKFLAIMPATDTEADFSGLEKQGISVRKSSREGIWLALRDYFPRIAINPYSYPARQRQYINWFVEATK